MNPPLVSICIPTYNRPEYLRRAVESCLKQTCPNFEIIITDNSANPDNSNRLDSKLMVEKTWTDPRIRYFKNEGSIGTEASCNRAISVSHGKYIKFLMDDDLLKPRCLELMVKALEENPKAGVVMAPMDLIDESDARIYPRFYMFRTMQHRYRYQVGDALIDRRRILRDFLTRDYPCTVPTGIMFRQEALPDEPLRRSGKVAPQDDFAGDLDLCMRVAMHWDFYYIDEVLSSFRYVDTSHTARLHKSGLNVKVFYYFTADYLSDPAVKEMFKDDWNQLQRDAIFFCSCRALLNAMAGVRSRNPRLIFDTGKIIVEHDKFVLNWFRLPFFAIRQVLTSLVPRHDPPPREGG